METKKKINFTMLLLILIGFVIRIYFVDKVVVGDIFNNLEWGQKLVERGPKDYYFSSDWYYSVPVYPPASILMFGGAYYLYEHKYLVAQLHNIIHFPPSSFVVYFYDHGFVLLEKLPAILSDLLIAILIMKTIYTLTKKKNIAYIGGLFYLFNPISIFLSGVWGQTDSLVALFGMMAFLLIKSNLEISIPLMFLGLFFKPSWAILLLFYFYVIYFNNPNIKKFIIGGLIALFIFIITTLPFSDKNVFSYGWELFTKRYPIPLMSSGKASVSAFNFQTIFYKMDIDFQKQNFGILFYLIFNFISIKNLIKQKGSLYGVLSGMFIISLGSFLFLGSMLERYFFPAFIPLIILAFSNPKLILNLIVFNIIFFANIFHAFYRRTWDEMHHVFIDYNFLLIKTLSVIQVVNYLYFVNVLQSAKIKLWKK